MSMRNFCDRIRLPYDWKVMQENVYFLECIFSKHKVPKRDVPFLPTTPPTIPVTVLPRSHPESSCDEGAYESMSPTLKESRILREEVVVAINRKTWNSLG
jgi:hypothetical protein